MERISKGIDIEKSESDAQGWKKRLVEELPTDRDNKCLKILMFLLLRKRGYAMVII